jgi:hypothetical protein
MFAAIRRASREAASFPARSHLSGEKQSAKTHQRFAMSAFGGEADMAVARLGVTNARTRNHDDHRGGFNQKLVVHWRTFGTSSAQKQRFLAR